MGAVSGVANSSAQSFSACQSGRRASSSRIAIAFAKAYGDGKKSFYVRWDGARGDVTYDPAEITLREILEIFFVIHDPTSLNRQGNDAGTQYRSAIYCDTDAQYAAAIASRDAFQAELTAAGYGAITTEILHPAPTFYYAEEEHQQYLSKNPGGYCGLGGTGVSCPSGL